MKVRDRVRLKIELDHDRVGLLPEGSEGVIMRPVGGWTLAHSWLVKFDAAPWWHCIVAEKHLERMDEEWEEGR